MKDTEVFPGKSLTDILRDIHDNALTKRQTINSIITQMTNTIKGADDAAVVAPLIKEFLDVGIRNDEHLVKIATIVQRVISADAYQKNPVDDPDGFMSEEEKAQLMKNALSDMKMEVVTIDDELKDINSKVTDVVRNP